MLPLIESDILNLSFLVNEMQDIESLRLLKNVRSPIKTCNTDPTCSQLVLTGSTKFNLALFKNLATSVTPNDFEFAATNQLLLLDNTLQCNSIGLFSLECEP